MLSTVLEAVTQQRIRAEKVTALRALYSGLYLLSENRQLKMQILGGAKYFVKEDDVQRVKRW